MSAREYREDKLPAPQTKAELRNVLDLVLALRGLVSFDVSRDGIAVRHYRELVDPPLSVETLFQEPALDVVLARLEEIYEAEDTASPVLALARASHYLSARGLIPTVLVLHDLEDLGIFREIHSGGFGVSVNSSPTLAGLRVVASNMLAEKTFLVLGGLVASPYLDNTRVAVRAFFVDGGNNG